MELLQKKKFFMTVLAWVVLGSPFLSCAKSGGTSAGASAGTSASPSGMPAGKSAVTLKLGIWDKNQEGGIAAVLEDFTAGTGIRVNVELTPWQHYWTLLEAAAGQPDVFWMHSSQAAGYIANGMLMDLTDHIARSAV
ncbi:MAG: extracellular solute-binding protein [Treponema sp.]|jgi:multiple sugar transport system substrate-binding protein|nr:extracellular solute-binding protein [Treponema sp.]